MLLIDSVWPRIVLDTVNDCAAAPESTNQPIKQPTNQPINQPTNQTIKQSTNQPINQSINQSIVKRIMV